VTAATQPDLLRLSVSELLDLLAERRRVPGSGSVAAVVVAAAAAIVARAARYSAEAWPEADAAAAQAQALRARAMPLAGLDAEAFGRAIAALDEPQDADAERRDYALGRALAGAADVPLRIAAAGADTALLAAEVAERGSAELRPDVAAAALLAEGATRMASHLVAVNLGAAPTDERVTAAAALVKLAGEGARRASAA
jgi:formiminotetrahydrofolate cyclodeaminase